MNRSTAREVRVVANALHRLRRAGDDIAARPHAYARVIASEPRLGELIGDFVRSWRTASGAVAMYALMARRPDPVKFDPLAFVRLVGRDIGANPGVWADLVHTQPRFGDDCARLARSLLDALQPDTPTAYA